MDSKMKGFLIVIIALIIPIIIFTNYDAIAKYDWASLSYLGVFLVMLITSATLILPVPGLAVATIAGTVANPLLIGIAGGLGSAVGELTGYLAGYGGSEIINGKKMEKHGKIKKMLMEKDRAFLLIFFLALIPNPLFDVAGIAAGTIRYPAWKFLLACALGKIIKVAVFAYLGYLTIETIW